MSSGFSLIEILVVLTISFTVLTVVITNITEGISVSNKVTSKQQVLESLFFTVDTIKSDLTKCGMRLQEAKKYFDLPLFNHSENSFKTTYGVASEFIKEDAFCDEESVKTGKNLFFKKGEKVLIYNLEEHKYELNQIKNVKGSSVILKEGLKNDYIHGSTAVILKESEFKLYKNQNILKRKTGKGYFQPLIEKVTDFYITYFPDANSVLYRIEVNNKEQVRGYIFLTNMVE
ncbi:MAG: type II secretion system protein [Acidobacteriota bacterium]